MHHPNILARPQHHHPKYDLGTTTLGHLSNKNLHKMIIIMRAEEGGNYEGKNAHNAKIQA
jgi:hypothetical protein